MKTYKFLDGIWLSSVEGKINGLAEEGWTVKSFTVVAEGESNDDKNAYVLLEMDDNDETGDVLRELQDVNEKLSDIYERLSSSGNRNIDGILDRLTSMDNTLDGIYTNTAG